MRGHIFLFLVFGLFLSGCLGVGEKTDCENIADMISDETGRKYSVMAEESTEDETYGCYIASQSTERDVVMAYGTADISTLTESDITLILSAVEYTDFDWVTEERELSARGPMPYLYLEGTLDGERLQRVIILKDGWLLSADIYGTYGGELHPKGMAFRIAEGSVDYLNSKE